MASPLLFSFSDNDASPTINTRVGNQVIQYGIPQVGVGVLVRGEITFLFFSGAPISTCKKVRK